MMKIRWCRGGARCTGHLRAPPHRYPRSFGEGGVVGTRACSFRSSISPSSFREDSFRRVCGVIPSVEKAGPHEAGRRRDQRRAVVGRQLGKMVGSSPVANSGSQGPPPEDFQKVGIAPLPPGTTR
jgi:hypothetical protein